MLAHRPPLIAPVPPAAGAIVMGTGIVSVALALDGALTLSRVLLGATALAWLAFTALVGRTLARDRAHAPHLLHVPAIYTLVAGTAVLGTRVAMAGWRWEATGLLAVAAALWAVLLAPVLRHWPRHTAGAAFVVAVATESIALLAGVLADQERRTWLLAAALVAFLAGLLFYLATLRRFDARELLVGRGDQWVAGGALAIATLAAAHLARTADDLHALAGGHVLRLVALALWAAAMAWLPVLVAAELRRPRPRYDLRRWATVFPLGMYAACGFAVARVDHAGAIADFSRVWVWAAFAVWALAAAGLVEAWALSRRR